MYKHHCSIGKAFFHTSSFGKTVLCGLALLYPLTGLAQVRLQSDIEARIEAANPTPPPAHAELYNELRVPLSPYSGAGSDFLARHDDYAESLAQGDLAAATRSLEKLQRGGTLNDYENVYLQLAHYQLAEMRADLPAQAQRLQRMLDTVDDANEVVLLPEGLEMMALRALFKAQVQLNHLAEAKTTFARIAAAGDDEAVAAFRPGIAQIETLASNEQSYPVLAQLGDEGQWSLALHKRQFFIDQVQDGSVTDVEIACENKSQTIDVEVEFGYTVPAALGACSLHFAGEPGTRFVLTQYRD